MGDLINQIMNKGLNQDLLYLSVLGFFYLYGWIPASIGKKQQMGSKWLASNRSKPAELTGWPSRAERAFRNLQDYFLAFVLVVLVIHVLGLNDEGTLRATQVFVFARLLHFAFYIYGSVMMRAICWLIALVAHTYLFYRVFEAYC